MSQPSSDRNSAPADEAGAAFDRWLDEFLADLFARRPIDATFIGVHRHDHLLPDFSPSGRAETVSRMRSALARLDHIPADALDRRQRIDRRLAAGALELEIWEDTARQFYRGNPSTYTGDAVFSIIALFQRDGEPLADRVDAAIARMTAIGSFLEQCRDNVRVSPAEWTARAIRETDAALIYFSSGLKSLAEDRAINGPAFLAASELARQAFDHHRRWLVDDLANQTTDDVACGRDAFERYLRLGHCLDSDQDASWVWQTGSEAIERATAELEQLASSIDSTRTWRELLETAPDHHPSVSNYYSTYDRVWREAKAAALGAELVTWPDFPIEFVPIPRSDREASPDLYYLFYRCPAPFGRSETHRYLVTPIDQGMPETERNRRLRANNDSTIKLNHVVHHGGLGHHVQNWCAARAASRVGQIAGVDGASRIALFCAGTLVEGWACYATDLMEEIGALTPLETLVQAQGRLRMACRAVADVAIHTGQMSLNDAADFYEAEGGMSPSAAMAEAVKNSMFPGAAMMYLVGTRAIHALRREVAAREGPRFSRRSFHDRFLSYGAIPVSLIRAEMLADAATDGEPLAP